MSRHCRAGALLIAALLAPTYAAAQSDPPETIDILVAPEDYEGPLEDCSEEQEAATISGEIIVCRRRQNGNEYGYDKDRARARYAKETMDRDNPKTPDFIADCHDQGWPAGCFRMGKVPPPVYYIDIEALPEAPPGSDADRISRGLAPLAGDATAPVPTNSAVAEDELGLPPPPGKVSPSGSASLEALPSD